MVDRLNRLVAGVAIAALLLTGHAARAGTSADPASAVAPLAHPPAPPHRSPGLAVALSLAGAVIGLVMARP